MSPNPSGGSLRTQVDGRVFAAEPTNALLAGWSGPTVVAGWRTIVPPGADFVASDDEHGGQLATNTCWIWATARSAISAGPAGRPQHRRVGYRKAMRRAGLEPSVVTSTSGTTEQDGYDAAAAAARPVSRQHRDFQPRTT